MLWGREAQWVWVQQAQQTWTRRGQCMWTTVTDQSLAGALAAGMYWRQFSAMKLGCCPSSASSLSWRGPSPCWLEEWTSITRCGLGSVHVKQVLGKFLHGKTSLHSVLHDWKYPSVSAFDMTDLFIYFHMTLHIHTDSITARMSIKIRGLQRKSYDCWNRQRNLRLFTE